MTPESAVSGIGIARAEVLTMEDGKITIAPDVLLTIAQLTTLQVEGVSRLSHTPAKVNRLFKKGYGEGVNIEVTNDTVYADIYLIMKDSANLREVSRTIQYEVGRALTDMIGMKIGSINIHIEDIDFPEDVEA
jgi:uncharacterized alkaline shock family protein YloU